MKVEFNLPGIKAAEEAAGVPLRYEYEICCEYWTLARCSNYFLALLIWWWFTKFRFGRACVLISLVNGHYIKTLRPRTYNMFS
jgi:hypothetical protein